MQHGIGSLIIGKMTSCTEDTLLEHVRVGTTQESLTIMIGLQNQQISVVHSFPSSMAQNFWMSIFAWVTCFLVTIAVSLVTTPKSDADLRNLVYGLTELPSDAHEAWYRRPAILAMVVGVAVLTLNVLFW